MLSNEQSATPPRTVVSAPASDRHTPNHAKEGGNAYHASIAISKATFHGSSRVTSTGTIHTKLLVDE